MGKFTDRTCCFIGQGDIPPGEESKVLVRVRHRLMPLIQSGVIYFGVGGTNDFDAMMVDMLLRLKKETPRLRIIEVLPFKGYRMAWPVERLEKAMKIDRQVDKVVYMEEVPRREAYIDADRHLVEGSNYCISYCNKATGRKAAAVKYALERGLTVYNASSFDVNTLISKTTNLK